MATIRQLGGNVQAILDYFKRAFITEKEARQVIAGLRRKKNV
jgi:hypothetical protein